VKIIEPTETKVENINPKVEETEIVKTEEIVENENNQPNTIQDIETNKKSMKNFDLCIAKSRNIDVNSKNKINPKETVPDPIIMKEENGAFVFIKNYEEHELDIILNEDDPKIAIIINRKDPIKRVS
jgi:hypothetical protein